MRSARPRTEYCRKKPAAKAAGLTGKRKKSPASDRVAVKWEGNSARGEAPLSPLRERAGSPFFCLVFRRENKQKLRKFDIL